MAESALQRLLRLKKEKENAPASTTEQSSPLEKVQGQSPEAGTGTGDDPTGVSPNSGGELLHEEGTRPSSESLPVDGSSNVAESSPSAGSDNEVDSTTVVQVKPMSAMERLRALKSGGVVAPAKPAQEVKQEEVVPPKPQKPRATHPIAMEMAELEAALDAEVPGFVSILSQIHKKLRADPDVVTLLDDEEIGVIVAGLEKHTNVTIVAPSAIKAAKSKAKKEPVTAMDL